MPFERSNERLREQPVELRRIQRTRVLSRLFERMLRRVKVSLYRRGISEPRGSVVVERARQRLDFLHVSQRRTSATHHSRRRRATAAQLSQRKISLLSTCEQTQRAAWLNSAESAMPHASPNHAASHINTTAGDGVGDRHGWDQRAERCVRAQIQVRYNAVRVLTPV